MSTSETVEFDLGPCPCKSGRLVRIVTTQDNPWSSADIRRELRCSPCSSEWHVDDGWMTLRSSEAESKQAMQQRQKAYTALKAVADSIVADYFKGFGATTKKAEHAQMVKLDITSLSYRGYLDARKGGQPLHSAAAPLRNKTWLMAEAAKQAQSMQLASLLTAADAAEEVWLAATEKIIRKKFD